MQCSEIRELLSAYIDGVLDPNEKTAVQEHLMTCGECSRDLADLQETIRLLHSLGDISPPERFRKELREKLNKESLPNGRIINLFLKQKARRWISGPGKYLAVSVIIIGLGFSTGIYNLLQSGLAPKSASYDMVMEENSGSGSERMMLQSVPENPEETTIESTGFIAGAPADETLRKAQAPEVKGGGYVDLGIANSRITASEVYSQTDSIDDSATITSETYPTADPEEAKNITLHRVPVDRAPTAPEAAKDALIGVAETGTGAERSVVGWVLPISLIIAGIGGVIYYFSIRRTKT
ncbi:anti-sigma factor family protein [Phosphitispora sp. TUW77]|uniref:anti-sigma factor family protein n=1 Tax=Phosphitispora sp. TUW77 TaxID=3152361 RepID=UPI003AB87269